MRRNILPGLAMGMLSAAAIAVDLPPLKIAIGVFQPDKEKNDSTYRAITQYLSQELGREIQLRTVDTWEGLAK
jgi:phosphonate transport system substrate-binding protein